MGCKKLNSMGRSFYTFQTLQFDDCSVPHAAVRRLFSPSRIRRYTDPLLWRSDGPICERAKTFELPNVQKAVDWLQKSQDKRQPGGNAAHEHMRA